MNEEILSQEHMLSQQEISELETSDCHTLVEEMHGTYGPVSYTHLTLPTILRV